MSMQEIIPATKECMKAKAADLEKSSMDLLTKQGFCSMFALMKRILDIVNDGIDDGSVDVESCEFAALHKELTFFKDMLSKKVQVTTAYVQEFVVPHLEKFGLSMEDKPAIHRQRSLSASAIYQSVVDSHNQQPSANNKNFLTVPISVRKLSA